MIHVDYLDSHAGAVQAVSAVILVVVTTWYAILTRRMAKSALESRRPYVFVDLRSEGGRSGELVLGNDGDRSAQDIDVAVSVVGSEELADSITTAFGDVRHVLYLAPGRRYRYRLILPAEDIFARPEDEHVLIRFNLSYMGDGRRYAESFMIDVTALNGVLLTSFTDPGEAIAGSIKDLARIEQGRDSSQRMQSMVSRRRKCPTCGSLIDSEARKCPACMEWIAESAVDGEDPKVNTQFD